MRPSHFFSIILIFTVACTVFESCSAIFVACRPCVSQEECDLPPPQFCVYGENRDKCSRRVCSKGPGEKCGGGDNNLMGVCGEGMMCSSAQHRCHGCFMPTMECYPK